MTKRELTDDKINSQGWLILAGKLLNKSPQIEELFKNLPKDLGLLTASIWVAKLAQMVVHTPSPIDFSEFSLHFRKSETHLDQGRAI